MILNNANTDIVCLTEHWMSADELESCKIQNYNLAGYYSRNTHKHGGVCLLVKNHVPCNNLEFLRKFNEDLEFEISGIRLYKLNLIVLVLYRSPLGNLDLFLSKLEESLTKICELNYSVILLGDFNINFLNRNSTDTVNVVDLLQSFNLHMKVTVPTRTTLTSSTCIDNCFSDLDGELIKATVLDLSLSDHYSIDVRIKRQITEKCVYTIQRPITHTRLINFTNDIIRFDWNKTFRQNSAKDMFRVFFSEFQLSFINNFPQRNLKCINRPNKIEWYDTDLKLMKEKLDILSTIYKCTKSEETYNLHKKYKTEYNNHLNLRKRNANIDFIRNSDNKSKASWKVINASLNRKPKQPDSPNLSPDVFNNFFASIPETITKSIPDSVNGPNYYLNNSNRHQTRSFYLRLCTNAEIFTAIMGLKNSSAEDAYGMTARIIKHVAPFLSEPLARLLNRCIHENYFPNELKISKITPLFKGGNKSDPASYRPIAIIPMLSKVFEEILKERLIDYFSTRSLFCDQQYGYLKGKSTINAICNLIDVVTHEFDEGHKPSATLLDLSKAFDCVPHSILLEKLRYYGIRGDSLCMFESYLSHRKQIVVTQEGRSFERDVGYGVAQGSKLGPILFLIYINDLCSNIETCQTILYADDTTLLVTGDSPTDIQIKEAVSISSAEQWFRANKFSLNTNKTQKIIFETRPNVNHSVKMLGVYIDSALSWSCHTDVLCAKLNTALYQIRRIIDVTNVSTAKTIYYANFYSLINNNIILWGTTHYADRVFKIQKKCVRAMMGVNSRDHCKPHFQHLQLLTIPSLYIFNCLMYIKKNMNALETQSDIHTYSTRNQSLLRIPYHRLTITQKSIKYQGIKLYNSLRLETRLLPLSTFKSKIKHFLISHSFYTVNDFLLLSGEL